MSGAILPTRLADLARGDLAWLRAFSAGQGTPGTSLAAQLDARHDTEKQDTLLTWAARHGQAEAVRLLLEGGASVGATTGGGASALLVASDKGHLEIARLLREAGAATDQAMNDPPWRRSPSARASAAAGEAGGWRPSPHGSRLTE